MPAPIKKAFCYFLEVFFYLHIAFDVAQSSTRGAAQFSFIHQRITNWIPKTTGTSTRHLPLPETLLISVLSSRKCEKMEVLLVAKIWDLLLKRASN